MFHSGLCVCFARSVSDTEKCSFVNTRWALHTPPSKTPPLKEDRLSFSGQKLDWRILVANFPPSFSSFFQQKPSSQSQCIMSMSETAEVCLLIHPPTNNCPFSSSPPHNICFWQNLQNHPPFVCCSINWDIGYLKVLA